VGSQERGPFYMWLYRENTGIQDKTIESIFFFKINCKILNIMQI
jgi:hypothetical protein